MTDMDTPQEFNVLENEAQDLRTAIGKAQSRLNAICNKLRDMIEEMLMGEGDEHILLSDLYEKKVYVTLTNGSRWDTDYDIAQDMANDTITTIGFDPAEGEVKFGVDDEEDISECPYNLYQLRDYDLAQLYRAVYERLHE